jgi:hypothetical protein
VTITLSITLARPDDALDPILDEDNALDWAMKRLSIEQSQPGIRVLEFEPDAPGCPEQEAKAQAGLGVRPFSE